MSEAQQRLASNIFSAAPGFLALLNRELVYEAANPRFCQFLARGPQEIAGKTDAELFPEAEAAIARKEAQTAMKAGTPRHCVQQLTGKDGARWFEVTRSPFFDAEGDPAGLLLFAHDVTALRQREERVQALEAAGQEQEALSSQVEALTAERSAIAAKLQEADTARVELQQVVASLQQKLQRAEDEQMLARAALEQTRQAQAQARALAEQLLPLLQDNATAS